MNINHFTLCWNHTFILKSFLLYLIFITSHDHQIKAIDFQIGKYLHKFFKSILPNNTNYRRKEDDELPLLKLYSKYYDSTGVLNDKHLDGISVITGDGKYPTLPFCNYTYRGGQEDPWKTSASTPSRDQMLKFGKIFKDAMKRGFKDWLVQWRQGSTTPENYDEVFRNYEEQELNEALERGEQKFHKDVHSFYTKTNEYATTTEKSYNFWDQVKDIYKNKLSDIFNPGVKTTTHETETTTEDGYKQRKSVEEKDKELMEKLRKEGDELIGRKQLEEQLKDIATPENFVPET